MLKIWGITLFPPSKVLSSKLLKVDLFCFFFVFDTDLILTCGLSFCYYSRALGFICLLVKFFLNFSFAPQGGKHFLVLLGLYYLWKRVSCISITHQNLETQGICFPPFIRLKLTLIIVIFRYHTYIDKNGLANLGSQQKYESDSTLLYSIYSDST